MLDEIERLARRPLIDIADRELHVKQAAAQALATTKLGVGLNPLDQGNPLAVFDNYIDRVAAQCVEVITPKLATRLAGFDAYL